MNIAHLHPLSPSTRLNHHLHSKTNQRLFSSCSDKSLTPIKKLSEQFLLSSVHDQRRTIKRYNSTYFKCNFTYKSPQHRTISKGQNYMAQLPSISHFSPVKAVTPLKKVKKLSQLRNKIIKKLEEVKTVQSKFEDSASPTLKVQESDILFKGSRDVENIMPTKLTYDHTNVHNNNNSNKKANRQLSQTKHQSSSKFNSGQRKQLYKIRKTDTDKYLVRQLGTMGIFSIYHNTNSQYTILSIDNPNVMKIFHQVNEHIYIIQPYQYSLKQLICMGKTNTEVMSKITKQLNQVRQSIQDQYNTNIQMGTLCQIVYYVHGVVKILPLVYKKSLTI